MGKEGEVSKNRKNLDVTIDITTELCYIIVVINNVTTKWV